jgi:hypothetical protein
MQDTPFLQQSKETGIVGLGLPSCAIQILRMKVDIVGDMKK